MTYRIGSVCSGIGGLELGLERAGVGSVVWQCEVDAFCRSVLAKHWPMVPRFVHVQSLCRTLTPPAVDVICGGFPCQDLSVAGRRAGLVEGAKSSLFFEVARVVSALSPRFVVLENVAGVLGPAYDLLVGTMAAIGYDLWWDCVPAASVGAPHLRDRWFAIGWLANARRIEDRSARSPERMAGASAKPCVEDRAGLSFWTRVGQHVHQQRTAAVGAGGAWDRGWAPEPDVGGASDGVPGRVDGSRWPTPTASDGRGSGSRNTVGSRAHPGVSLTDAVRGDGGLGRLWPTPLASDGRRSADGDTREGGPSLTEVAALPSPAETWERGVPRTCGSDSIRDARLEALGNAVSPVVSEVIGRVLLDLDADLRRCA